MKFQSFDATLKSRTVWFLPYRSWHADLWNPEYGTRTFENSSRELFLIFLIYVGAAQNIFQPRCQELRFYVTTGVGNQRTFLFFAHATKHLFNLFFHRYVLTDHTEVVLFQFRWKQRSSQPRTRRVFHYEHQSRCALRNYSRVLRSKLQYQK